MQYFILNYERSKFRNRNNMKYYLYKFIKINNE